MRNVWSIKVENIKCGGCVSSIQNTMLQMPGVSDVVVSRENESVSISGNKLNRQRLVNRLAELGYPEKGNNSLFSKVKSYISCANGKIM